MMLDKNSLSVLKNALDILDCGFDDLPDFTQSADISKISVVLNEAAHKMRDNYPYPHPLYAGQMLKPPHPVARLAYMLSLWINPNNHALDGGRCSSAMEKEAVGEIARMFGWDAHLGHLTGGGTIANLEALWIASKLNPGKLFVASQQAHYTHERMSGVLGITFKQVPCDKHGRMDMNELHKALKHGNVGTVIATIGTTATGAVDPLPKILELQEEYGFRLHADAAYGGYYILAGNLDPETRSVYDHLGEVDSIVIDPHKHGLQPYGCGCVLFKDPAVGIYYKHESPYTYFTSKELHLGEISLECSRAGAAAVALWATQRLLPPTPGGEFAIGLESCRSAALKLFDLLSRDKRFVTAFAPELDIVVWSVPAASASKASKLADSIFDITAKNNLHLAKANLPKYILEKHWPDLTWDQDYITCLRSCLMKPEHLDWTDSIYGLICEAADLAQGLKRTE
jgi:tyrosine decarboxylase / aspartate 1-decarboxylase